MAWDSRGWSVCLTGTVECGVVIVGNQAVVLLSEVWAALGVLFESPTVTTTAPPGPHPGPCVASVSPDQAFS